MKSRFDKIEWMHHPSNVCSNKRSQSTFYGVHCGLWLAHMMDARVWLEVYYKNGEILKNWGSEEFHDVWELPSRFAFEKKPLLSLNNNISCTLKYDIIICPIFHFLLITLSKTKVRSNFVQLLRLIFPLFVFINLPKACQANRFSENKTIESFLLYESSSILWNEKSVEPNMKIRTNSFLWSLS